MRITSVFRDRYLEELALLDGFLHRHAADSRDVDSADPEVRRVLEAVAYFAARTEQMARRGALDATRALVAEHLDFLSRPLAARALVQAVHSGEASTPVRVPQGTPFVVKPHGSDPHVPSVQLASEVSAIIAPLTVCDVFVEQRAGTKWLCVGVHATVGFAELDSVSLYVDVLGDLSRSLQLHGEIASNCRSVRLAASGTGGVRQRSAVNVDKLHECRRLSPVSFGARRPVPPEFDDAFEVDRAPSVLEGVRQHFQLPERDLFINVDIRGQAVDATRLWLAFELRGDSGVGALDPSCFRTNVLPVENALRAPAMPIKDDGTRRYHPLMPPAELADDASRSWFPFELLEVEKVVEFTRGGEVVLLPSALGDAGVNYRLARRLCEDGRERSHLELGRGGSLGAPRAVRVDGVWTQPGLDLGAMGRVKIRPWRLATKGIEWKQLPKMAAYTPSPIEDSPEKIAELLALQARHRPQREDVLKVARLLCAWTDTPWDLLIGALGSMTFSDYVEAKTGAVHRRISVEVRTVSLDLLPLFEDFRQQLQIALSAWGDNPVELTMRLSESERRQLVEATG